MTALAAPVAEMEERTPLDVHIALDIPVRIGETPVDIVEALFDRSPFPFHFRLRQQPTAPTPLWFTSAMPVFHAGTAKRIDVY